MIPVNEPLMAGAEWDYVRECIDTGWISSAGKFIDRFEAEWARYCGRKHGVAVSNGTVALELGLSALKLPAGAEVVLPSFTIVSCLEAVLRNGLSPVLVDCDPDTYCMDPDGVAAAITPRTAALMPVHIYGHPCDMARIMDLAARHGLRVLEDAAEAHGTECRLRDGAWRRCGSFGDASAFSFYANKNITCGEGGMVLTDDDALAGLLRARRNLCFGNRDRFRHEDRGWNFRMTNLQAAMGCAQLEKIDAFVARKRAMAARYTEGLRGLPLQCPAEREWARSSIWMYAVVLRDEVPYDATEFARRLSALGVQTRPFFLGMHEQPVYRQMGLFRDVRLPVAERIARRGLYLPSGQAITDAQIDQVVRAVREVFAGMENRR